MKTYKTYNLKMSKETHLKLQEIEIYFNRKSEKTLTKSDVLKEIIDAFKIQKK